MKILYLCCPAAMIKHFKAILKNILFHLHIDLTRNQQYDRQTLKIMKQALHPESNCIDIGCHKGEMLDAMLVHSPKGHHWAFEPLPQYFELLQEKYSQQPVTILPFALSDERKRVIFNHVLNAPAFSGLKERKYHCNKPLIEKIEVQAERLDNIILPEDHIDFIKIDVEGGEFGVLQGAKEVLTRDKPLVIFEFGLGAADYYGTTAGAMFDLLEGCGLKVSLMKDFLHQKQNLSRDQFTEQYQGGRNYYFIAHP